jgi:hypothetical protein
MRAITLHQPWASLIAFGLKSIETRTHDRFRGLVGQTIAIHAGQKWDELAFSISWPLTDAEMAREAAAEYGADGAAVRRAIHAARGAAGCVVAVVDVADHRRLTGADSRAALCQAEGLFGLVLVNVRRFREPIAARGHQGIWEWEPPEDWGGASGMSKPLTHRWAGRKWLPERYGQRLRLLVCRRGKYLVEFGDGTKVVTMRGTFRRLAD